MSNEMMRKIFICETHLPIHQSVWQLLYIYQ